jgi:hypothetical protein
MSRPARLGVSAGIVAGSLGAITVHFVAPGSYCIGFAISL